jgi:hypothetical protein
VPIAFLHGVDDILWVFGFSMSFACLYFDCSALLCGDGESLAPGEQIGNLAWLFVNESLKSIHSSF